MYTSDFVCKNCPIEVNYFISLKKINYIYFTIKKSQHVKYEICLDKVQNECCIIKIDALAYDKASKVLMSLNYIPDINPDSVTAWLDRILKLMIFS
jgi:hypothetical protein